MKALILSLVIAFSSSFALACNKPDASFGDHTGAYTKKVQTVKALVRVGGSQSGVQVK